MRNWELLSGLGAGAGAMYLLDPQGGRRRIGRLGAQALALAHTSQDALGGATRDLANRVRGLAARAARLVREDTAADEVVEERVRAALGRRVSHPHALAVTAQAGTVTLFGPVLADEAGPLLSAVCRVRGVARVIDQLEVHENAEGIPALQGGNVASVAGRRSPHERWTPAARLVASAAGGGLAAWGLVRRDWMGAAAGSVGACLLARGLVNHPLAEVAGLAHEGRLLEVHKTVTVGAPRPRVFELWTRYENFPRFLSTVKEVRDLGDGRSHWTVSGPGGVSVSWQARITRLVPGHLLTWESAPGSAVSNTGSIHFEDAGEGATRVTVHMTCEPPAGVLGHLAATLFGADPRSRLDQDLLRMKTFVETGTIPHDAALLH